MAKDRVRIGKLRLAQEDRRYEFGFPNKPGSALLRVIPPTKPYGAYPGNSLTIRHWQISQPNTCMYRACTHGEITRLERLVGELSAVGFMEHPTIGLVTYEAKPKE